MISKEFFGEIILNNKENIFGIKGEDKIPKFILDYAINSLYENFYFFLLDNKYFFSIEFDPNDENNYVCNLVFSTNKITSVKEYKEFYYSIKSLENFFVKNKIFTHFSGGSIEILRWKKLMDIKDEDITEMYYSILYSDSKIKYFNLLKMLESINKSRLYLIYVFGQDKLDIEERIEYLKRKNIKNTEIRRIFKFKSELKLQDNIDENKTDIKIYHKGILYPKEYILKLKEEFKDGKNK